MPSRRIFSWRSIRRRLTAAGAVLAYLAATIGLPLLPPPIVKDGGKAFPCQGRACGCQTAEECWRHCCCTTPEERWAWAAEHNVQPPEYAEKPANDGWRPAPIRERAAAESCACCKGKPSPLVRWGLTASALRCQGLSTQWVTTGVVPATPPVCVRRPQPVVGERLTDGAVASRRVFQAPPFPPPRLPLSSDCI
jgi:hypothetical protein